MFKQRRVPLLLSIGLGVLFWVVDALLDHFIFYSRTFLDVLILNPPRSELYNRILVLVLFVIFGYLTGVFIGEVRKREKLYRGIVDHPSLYICRFTPDTRLTFANQAYRERTDLPYDEIIGQSFLPKIPEQDRDFVCQKLQSLTEDHPVTTYEHRVFNKEGEIEWQRWTDQALFNKKGELVEYQSIGYDITEGVYTQETYQALVEGSLQGLEIIQEEGIVFANQAMADLSGYTVEELLAFSLEDVASKVHPEDRERVMDNLQRQMRGGDAPDRQTFRILRKDGAVRWVETLSAEIEYQGKPANYVAAVDISDLIETEKSLKVRDKLLEETGKMAWVGAWEIDLDTKKVWWSKVTRDIHEVPPEYEPTVGEAMAFYPPDVRPRLEEVIQKAREEGEPYDLELPIVTAEGNQRWVHTLGEPEFSGGELQRLRGTIQDITDLKMARTELKQSVEKYRRLFQSATDALFLVDENTLDILDANLTAQELYGYTREELLSLKATDLSAQPEETKGMIYEFGAQTDAEGVGEFHVPLRYHKKKDGTVMVVEITAKHFVLQGKRVNLSLIRNITERTLMENELRRRKRELESLTARLVEADEVQRRRFARDLHDQVGQTLSLLHFTLDRVKGMMDAQPGDLEMMKSKIADAASLVEDTSQNIRRVINNLRPPVLDDYGLFAALHWYVDQLEDQVDMSLVVQGRTLEPRLPVRDENVLFRVAQEALGNVIRHARAARVTIQLQESDGFVVLEIADDGRGFEVADVGMEEETQGWGLINMRERAEVIGGSFSIESEKSKGTVVRVQVPRRESDD
ncbi:MAG: PAS domain S-box protein [Anaerolineales bacterium]